MRVYRLSKAIFARDLSGKGAERAGGRWNSKGTPMIYTSESRALCTAEIAVHTPLGNLPVGYVLIILNIPDDLKIKVLSAKSLPARWKAFPHLNLTQDIGDKFIRDKQYAVLKVPSAVVQGEYNYLLNPFHPDFHRIVIEKTEAFDFDERLFKA